MATNGWTGEIGEIIAYPTALNATDFQAVQNYLATKWDLGLSPPTEGTLHFGQLGAFGVVPERAAYDFLDLSFGKVTYTNPRPALRSRQDKHSPHVSLRQTTAIHCRQSK